MIIISNIQIRVRKKDLAGLNTLTNDKLCLLDLFWGGLVFVKWCDISRNLCEKKVEENKLKRSAWWRNSSVSVFLLNVSGEEWILVFPSLMSQSPWKHFRARDQTCLFKPAWVIVSLLMVEITFVWLRIVVMSGRMQTPFITFTFRANVKTGRETEMLEQLFSWGGGGPVSAVVNSRLPHSHRSPIIYLRTGQGERWMNRWDCGRLINGPPHRHSITQQVSFHPRPSLGIFPPETPRVCSIYLQCLCMMKLQCLT